MEEGDEELGGPAGAEDEEVNGVECEHFWWWGMRIVGWEKVGGTVDVIARQWSKDAKPGWAGDPNVRLCKQA